LSPVFAVGFSPSMKGGPAFAFISTKQDLQYVNVNGTSYGGYEYIRMEFSEKGTLVYACLKGRQVMLVETAD